MIRRVYEQATASNATAVYVATDDTRIAQEVSGFGGKVVMTGSDHPSGTDRIHEVAQKLGLGANALIVNVQGDEPLIPPEVINQVATGIRDGVSMASLCEPIDDVADVLDPNIVKVVRDTDDIALYFSRAPIPWSREDFPIKDFGNKELLPEKRWFRHLGIYAYTVDMLNQFVTWNPSEIEVLESLEQLRVLSHGRKIRVETAITSIPPGIDVPADVARTLNEIEGSNNK
jgi:3-deoxy-manno-octulosonate cytidylyltransferase (CMP-KDO synthetase)